MGVKQRLIELGGGVSENLGVETEMIKRKDEGKVR